jgi:hypothetical protein
MFRALRRTSFKFPPLLPREASLNGLDKGEFMIITDPQIRALATTRSDEVNEALDRLDAFLDENGLGQAEANS